MLKGMKIGVTGATGFLGSHLALALVERGADVVGVVRSPEKGRWLEERGVRLVRGDLLDPDAVRRAFDGLDAVVSNASPSTDDAGSDLDAFVARDRLATSHVVDAALDAGATRFVHISSVSVYRMRRPCRRVPVDQPHRTRGKLDLTRLVTRRGYPDCKASSEQVVWAARERGLRPTVLRPGPVYGSRDEKLTERWKRGMARRVRLIPTVGIPHVHAGDVAAAAAGALANDDSIGRAYNVTGEPTSLWEVARAFREARGDGPLLVPVPIPLWLGWDNTATERDLGVTYRSLEDGWREALR